MKNTFKHLTYCLLIVFSSITCVATSNNKLIIRGDNDFAPLSFINSQGLPDGLDADIIKEIMARTKIPYDFRLEDWDKVLEGYEDGNVDVISGITYNYDIAESGYLSGYTSVLNRYVIYRKGDKINQLSDLNQKDVVVAVPSTAQEYISRRVPNVKILESQSYSNEIIQLSEGKYDAVICNRSLATYTIEKNRLDNLILKDLEIPSTPYLILASNDTIMEKINSALFEMKRDGTYDKIYDKWFSLNPKIVIPTLAYIIAGMITIIALILYIFVVLLRKRVKKSSSLLNIKNKNLSVAIHAGNIEVLDYNIATNKFFNIQGDFLPKSGVTLHEMHNLIHPDDLEKFKTHFEGVLSGRIKDLKTLIIRTISNKSNNWTYGKFVLSPKESCDDTNIIIAYKNINREYIEKQRLAEMTQNLNLTMEAGGLAAWIYDVKNKILKEISTNNSHSKEFDRNNIIKILHRADRRMMKEALDDIVSGKVDKVNDVFRICLHSQIYSYEFVMRRKVSDAGYVNIAIRDVTQIVKEHKDLKEYQLKTELAIRNSNITQWDYDIESQKIVINDGSGNYNGLLLSKEEFYKIDGMKELFSRMDNRSIQPFTIDTVLRDSDGEVKRSFIISGAPLASDSNGRISKYTGFLNETTEMTIIRQQLEKEIIKAESSNRSKTAFLANMSHDIRTPLNAIVGFSDLLQDEIDPKVKSEYINIINTNSDLLLQLISDILDLARIEGGLLDFKDTEFDFALVFNDLAKGFEPKASKNKIEFIIDSPYKSCVITLDKNRVAQVITNYLSNALKYTPSGSIKVGYNYQNEGIYIYVKDTGIGIPEEKQYKVFQRFEKLDSFAQGSGLGLSICKAVVESCKGRVGFKSILDEGSIFWAWIPCRAKISE